MFHSRNYRYERASKKFSVEEILVRSSNVGSVILAKKIGEKNFKILLKKQVLQKS